MRTVKGNRRRRDYAAEISFDGETRAVASVGWPDLLRWLRRAHADPERSERDRRPPRIFWLLDPTTDEWHLL